MASARSLILTAAFAVLPAAQAFPADFAQQTEPTPAAAAEPFSWTGPFGGLFGGIGAGAYDYNADYELGGVNVLTATIEEDAGGAFGGAQIGFDYQFRRFVLGSVADIAASGIENRIAGQVDLLGIGGASAEAKSEFTYLGTIRGRLGFTPVDRFLVYGHGGFAYGGVERSVEIDGTTFASQDEFKTGYVIGAGFEFAVTPRLSVQTEYGYYDLGTDVVYSGPALFPGDDLTIKEKNDFHSVKAAINVRF